MALTSTQQTLLKADIITRLKTGDSDSTLEVFYNTQDPLAGQTTFALPKETFLKILAVNGDYFTVVASKGTNPVADLFITTLYSSAVWNAGIDMADPATQAQCQALVATAVLSQATMDQMTALCIRDCTWAEQLFGWGEILRPRLIHHLEIGEARKS